MKNWLNQHPNKTLLFCLGCLSALGMAPVYAWPLMIVGYSVLVIQLTKSDSWKTTAKYGFVFFLGYFLTGLYWISNSLFVELDRWWWALPLSFFGLSVLLSLFPTICLSLASLAKKWRTLAFILALIIADFARGHLFTGFPWNLPIHAWINNDAITYILPYFGFYSTNALIVVILCIPALLYSLNKTTKLIGGISLAIILLTSIIYKSTPLDTSTSTKYNIVMIQGNIAQKDKWNPDKIWSNFDRYINMSLESIESNDPHIIIWPETTISQRLIETDIGHDKFLSFLGSLPQNSVLITGILINEHERHYNSLHVYDTNGYVLSSYYKHHLVPFGEYMPLGLETITGFSGFSKGEKPQPIRISHLNFSFLPLICYESIFNTYSQTSTKADVLLNITNDAWFGKTAGPYQHFDHMRLRSIENKQSALRLSGNGISALIQKNGDIISSTQINSIRSINIKTSF